MYEESKIALLWSVFGNTALVKIFDISTGNEVLVTGSVFQENVDLVTLTAQRAFVVTEELYKSHENKWPINVFFTTNKHIPTDNQDNFIVGLLFVYNSIQVAMKPSSSRLSIKSNFNQGMWDQVFLNLSPSCRYKYTYFGSIKIILPTNPNHDPDCYRFVEFLLRLYCLFTTNQIREHVANVEHSFTLVGNKTYSYFNYQKKKILKYSNNFGLNNVTVQFMKTSTKKERVQFVKVKGKQELERFEKEMGPILAKKTPRFSMKIEDKRDQDPSQVPEKGLITFSIIEGAVSLKISGRYIVRNTLGYPIKYK